MGDMGAAAIGTFVSVDFILTALQCQALFILGGFCVAWVWAAWRRGLGRAQLERRGSTRTAYCKEEEQDADGRKDGEKYRKKVGTKKAAVGGGRNGDDDDDGDVSGDDALPPAPMVSVVMPVKVGWAVQAESSGPIVLERARCQPLSLSSDLLVSKVCCFRMQLVPTATSRACGRSRSPTGARSSCRATEVGLYTLSAV
jgi:hypothetical protein